MQPPHALPLTGWAQAQLNAIIQLGACTLPTAATLLGERAALNGLRVPGRVSAGGGCRLLIANDGDIALSLVRPDDRELLPALFEDAELDPSDDQAIAGRVRTRASAPLLARGRELGLAIASLAETPASPTLATTTQGRATQPRRNPPLVVDLAALWAGPLAANLLALTGAEVVKVESRTRPDALRDGDPALFARLNGGKASVVVDWRDGAQHAAVLRLLARADIVIEAARPRALHQLGIDADALVRNNPGLVWVTITGHGIAGDAAGWIGFGDDCGVAGGLSRALRDATGRLGFVGDATADPLSGIAAARAALAQRRRGTGARLVLSMSAVAAEALAWHRGQDPAALQRTLQAWAGAVGQPFPAVEPRPAGEVRPLGADSDAWLDADAGE